MGPQPNVLDELPVLGRWLGRRTDATPSQVALWLATHPQRERMAEVDEVMREAARDLRSWVRAVDLDTLPDEPQP